jgi:23S rRNA G2069 N7-methylase RlmK/C1962 C5-methylase RlmI
MCKHLSAFSPLNPIRLFKEKMGFFLFLVATTLVLMNVHNGWLVLELFCYLLGSYT